MQFQYGSGVKEMTNHDTSHLDTEDLQEYERRKANGNRVCGLCEGEGFILAGYDYVPYGSSGAMLPVSDTCPKCEGLIYLDESDS